MSWRRGERLPLRHDELPREPGPPSRPTTLAAHELGQAEVYSPNLCFQAGNHNTIQRRHLTAEMARETGHRVTVALPTKRDSHSIAGRRGVASGRADAIDTGPSLRENCWISRTLT